MALEIYTSPVTSWKTTPVETPMNAVQDIRITIVFYLRYNHFIQFMDRIRDRLDIMGWLRTPGWCRHSDCANYRLSGTFNKEISAFDQVLEAGQYAWVVSTHV